LPRRAGAFLDGVVRSQIDRLTPWNEDEASFGWSAPKDLPEERIVLTIAATRRTSLEASTRGLRTLGVDSVSVLAAAAESPETSHGVIAISSQFSQVEPQLPAMRRGLEVALGLSAAIAGAVFVTTLIVDDTLDAQQAELRHEISARRAAAAAAPDPGADPVIRELNARKRTTPSAVIVLEALSRALPDSAHLTQLHLEDGKVQLAGLAEDPSGLIRLIEKSPQFSHAAFAAPTTMSANENGERFHIEAHVAPIIAVLH
jgi:general secretion pathway protein L